MVRVGISKNRRVSLYEQVDLHDNEDTIEFTPKANNDEINCDEITYEPKSDSGDELDSTDQIANRRGRNLMTDTPSAVKRRPPKAAFFQKYKRRFPSYKRVSHRLRGIKNDKEREQQQSLTADVEGSSDKDQPNISEKLGSGSSFMKKIRLGPREYIDPAHYPLEQITDAEYGVSPSYSHTDASEDLRNMDTEADAHDSRKGKFIGVTCTLLILLIFIIAVTTKASPIDMEVVCSLEKISTKSGHRKCVDACDAGKCCFSSGKESCFAESEELCGRYTSCGNLYSMVDGDTNIEDGSSAPALARNDIDSICSDWSVATSSGHTACISACSPGRCCSTLDGLKLKIQNSPLNAQSCGNSHDDVCKSYAPCMSMKGMNNSFRSPQDVVNDLCTSKNIMYPRGRAECDDACQPRSCCFTTDSKRNCHVDNPVWCSVFKACEILTVQPGPLNYTDNGENNEQDISVINAYTSDSADTDGEIDDPDDDDNGVDNLDDNDPDNDDDVDDAYPDDSEDNFIAPIPQSILHGPPADQVYKVCSDPSKTNMCFALCSDYLCCFDVYYHQSITCRHTEEVCETYQSCSKIAYMANIDDQIPQTSVVNFDDGNYDDANEKSVDKICSIQSLISSSDAVERCKESCVDYMCCFGGDCERDDKCLKFQACSFFQGDEGTDDTNANSSENNKLNIISKPQHPLFTDLGLSAPTNTPLLNNNEALAPPLSTITYDSTHASDTGEGLESACQSKNIKTKAGQQKCKHFCKAWKCCWDSNNTERCHSFECILAIKACDIRGTEGITEGDLNCNEANCCWSPDENSRCRQCKCRCICKITFSSY